MTSDPSAALGAEPSDPPVVLVTGASSGIGLAFARAYAARGCALVLLARDRDRLEAVAAELRAAAGAPVEVVAADLATPDGLAAAANAVRTRPVDVLVSNAGFGTGRRFVGSSLDDELRLLDVLARAVLVLTHAALPGMLARGRGRIVTVASAAAFLPGGSYTAAKAWAVAFGRGLAAELAGTGVTSTVVCPGFVRTDFHRRAGLRLDHLPRAAWLDADELVAEALRDVERGRVTSIPSRRYRLLVAVVRRLPLRAADAWALRRGRRRVSRRARSAQCGPAPPGR